MFEVAAKVLIIDDDSMAREGLTLWLSRAPGLTVVGAAAGYDEALRLIESAHPELLIVAMSLHRGFGLDFITETTAKHGRMKVLILSVYVESLFAERASRAGARGYVSKTESGEIVLKAVLEVLDGRTYWSPSMQERLLNHPSQNTDVGLSVLSNREIEVLLLMGQGLWTRDIAGSLRLSNHTIETYREKIKSKLHLKNAPELWRFAVQTALEATAF